MRTTYIPKDMNDFQYVPCTPSKNSTVVTRNGNSYGGTEDISTSNAAQSEDNFKALFIGGSADTKCPYNVGGTTTAPTKAPFAFKFTRDADFIAMYWKGMLPSASADLRIDIVRKFNGFPRAEKRDILDLNKPKKVFDPKKTIDVIQELQTAIP